jgi:hypothetical protein
VSYTLQRSTLTLDHRLLYVSDSLSGIQSLWAGAGAIENGVTPVKPKRIFQNIEPFARRLITAIN